MPTDLMRAQLGEGAFQILTRWWRINDLMPIVEAPAPILNLRRLAFNFLLAPMDELAVLIRDLTPGPGVPAFVALGLERARFLHRHRAQLPLAQAMLAAAGNDITRADALMQFLAPYLAHPVRLAVARAELQRLGYDIPQAAPVVAFLAPSRRRSRRAAGRPPGARERRRPGRHGAGRAGRARPLQLRPRDPRRRQAEGAGGRDRGAQDRR